MDALASQIESFGEDKSLAEKIKSEFSSMRSSIRNLAVTFTKAKKQSDLTPDEKTKILGKLVQSLGRIYAKLNNQVNIHKVDKFEREASRFVRGTFNADTVNILNNILDENGDPSSFFELLAKIYSGVKDQIENEIGKNIRRNTSTTRSKLDPETLCLLRGGRGSSSAFRRGFRQ